MATITVRKLSAEVHRALRARAAAHGRSVEAEAREILETAVFPPSRLRLGTALAELGRSAGLSDDDIDVVEQARATIPAEPTKFD